MSKELLDVTMRRGTYIYFIFVVHIPAPINIIGAYHLIVSKTVLGIRFNTVNYSSTTQ